MTKTNEPKKLGEQIEFMGLQIERYEYPKWPEGSTLSEDYPRRRRKKRRRSVVGAGGMGAMAAAAKGVASGAGAKRGQPEQRPNVVNHYTVNPNATHAEVQTTPRAKSHLGGEIAAGVAGAAVEHWREVHHYHSDQAAAHREAGNHQAAEVHEKAAAEAHNQAAGAHIDFTGKTGSQVHYDNQHRAYQKRTGDIAPEEDHPGYEAHEARFHGSPEHAEHINQYPVNHEGRVHTTTTPDGSQRHIFNLPHTEGSLEDRTAAAAEFLKAHGLHDAEPSSKPADLAARAASVKADTKLSNPLPQPSMSSADFQAGLAALGQRRSPSPAAYAAESKNFVYFCGEMYTLLKEHIDLGQEFKKHHEVKDADGKFIPWDGSAPELMRDRLKDFLAKVTTVSTTYEIPADELVRLIDKIVSGQLLDKIVEDMGQGWARGDLNPPQPNADQYPSGPNNDEEPPLELGQDTSIVLIDPTMEPYELEGGIQRLKPKHRDERLGDPRYDHRSSLRRRAAGLGVIHSHDQAVMNAQPALTDRQWGELGSGDPDQSTIDDLLIQFIAAQQAGLQNAYEKMLAASGLSLQQAIEALQRAKRGVQGKNQDGNDYVTGPGAGMSDQPVYSGA